MSLTLDECAQRLGVDSWFSHQEDAFTGMAAQQRPLRACLYFKTGAGKTITALVPLALEGAEEVLVVAPPITHELWEQVGALLDIKVEAISHAIFRKPGYKVRRSVPLIVDEFHMLGGQGKQGWSKMDALARHLPTSLLILSATPNYNDAERVYCVKHVLDPHSCKGGFIRFIMENCTTEANAYSLTPTVTGFHKYQDAAEFLGSLPYVYYVPDDMNVSPEDIKLYTPLPSELEEYGVSRRKHKIVASDIEMRHLVSHDTRIENGFIRPHIMAVIEKRIRLEKKPTLLFCSTSTVAKALFESCKETGLNTALLTGTVTKKHKAKVFNDFKAGKYEVLVGTATLATGADGIDKMCDQLGIVQDTDDDAGRRQLIGRILPRGGDIDLSRKKVFRLVVDS